MSSAIVTFQCNLCLSGQMKGYETSWGNHLWSGSHQKKSRERFRSTKLTKEQRETLLVVFGLHGIPMKNVLGYFLDHNTITDFTFWENRTDLCVVEFFSQSHRTIFASAEHTILDHKIHVRLMDMIPDPEWVSICPSNADLPKFQQSKKPRPITVNVKRYANPRLQLHGVPSEGIDPVSVSKPGPECNKSNPENDSISSTLNLNGTSSLSSISSEDETLQTNIAKGEEAVEERPENNRSYEAQATSTPPVVSVLPTTLSSPVGNTLDNNIALSLQSTSSSTPLENEYSFSIPVPFDMDKADDIVLDQVDSRSSLAANTQESNKAASLSTVSSASLENENYLQPSPSSSTASYSDRTVSAQVDNTQTSSNTEEVQFLCEQKKNENAPLIEINDEEGEILEVENVHDLENMMEKMLESKQHMSQKDIDFRSNAKNRLELHLRLKYYARCRLIMFSFGTSLIHHQKNDVLHLYLDRWGSLDKKGHAIHKTQNKPACYMDVLDVELTGLMKLVANALKEPPADVSFIVTRVEIGVGGIIDFKYTNATDTIRCRVHLKDFDIVQSSRLLKLYCQLDDRVQPLMSLMLEWASGRKWFGTVTGSINHEMLVWMVIFFLVCQRFIPPPLFLLEHRRLSPEKADLWYCGKLVSFTDDYSVVKVLMANDKRFYPANFNVNSKRNPTARVILHLAGAMFLFYSNFDFSRCSIDLFMGRTTSKVDRCPMSFLGHPFSFGNIAQYVNFPRVMHFVENCAKSYNDVTELLKQDLAESTKSDGEKQKTIDLASVLHDDRDPREWRIDPQQFAASSSASKRARYFE